MPIPILAALLIFLQDPTPGTLTQEEAKQSITRGELYDHIKFLSTDEMKGRNTPSKELDKTAQYVSDAFRKAGLKPLGKDGTYILPWNYRGEEAPNCIGLLEGSDEKLKDEYIVIGGHMDHVGVIGGEIHNGADDNASGTSGVLELAEAFGALKVRPKRSIIFMTFGGEEKGLLGSRAYVNDPAIPNEKTVAMINLDMIGRSTDNYLFIGGTGTSPIWDGLVKKYNDHYKFNLETAPGGLAPSDNSNFYREDIPVLFFFTHVHEDYHLPGDDIEKVNVEASEKILYMVYDVVTEVAEAKERPAFTKENSQALPKDFQQKMMERYRSQNRNRVQLGVQVESAEGGVRIRSVSKDSVAQEAGLQKGDKIITFEGKEVASRRELQRALRKHKPGESVTLTIDRDGKTKEVKVTFPR